MRRSSSARPPRARGDAVGPREGDAGGGIAARRGGLPRYISLSRRDGSRGGRARRAGESVQVDDEEFRDDLVPGEPHHPRSARRQMVRARWRRRRLGGAGGEDEGAERGSSVSASSMVRSNESDPIGRGSRLLRAPSAPWRGRGGRWPPRRRGRAGSRRGARRRAGRSGGADDADGAVELIDSRTPPPRMRSPGTRPPPNNPVSPASPVLV